MGAADVTQVREMRLGHGEDGWVNSQVRVLSRRNNPPGPVSKLVLIPRTVVRPFHPLYEPEISTEDGTEI